MTEKTLSDKFYSYNSGYPEEAGGSMEEDKNGDFIKVEDVKKFIKKLKEVKFYLGDDIEHCQEQGEIRILLHKAIDKLAGEKLI